MLQRYASHENLTQENVLLRRRSSTTLGSVKLNWSWHCFAKRNTRRSSETVVNRRFIERNHADSPDVV